MTEIASEAREPTKAEREKAEAVYLAWCARGGWDWRDLVVKALAAASDEMKERAAKWHDEQASKAGAAIDEALDREYRGHSPSSYLAWWRSLVTVHEANAAAIRALEPGEGTT